MPTARDRMLELSPLPAGQGHTAREHFLAIELGTGGPTELCIYGETVVVMDTQELVAAIDADLEAVIEPVEYSVELDAEFVVECE